MSTTNLSLRLPVSPEMTDNDFLSIVKKWIDTSPFYKDLSELIKDGLTYRTKEVAKSSTIEVVKKDTNNDQWIIVKHINDYLEQEWETFLIFHGMNQKEIIIHISCLGDISHAKNFPQQRLEVIHTFAKNSDKIIYDKFFNGSECKVADEEDKELLVNIINGNTKSSLPVIYVTKFFGSAGYAVDLEALAKKLEGIAYVVCEPDDSYTHFINNRIIDTRSKLPKNGAIGIYFGGSKIFYPNNKYASLDGYIMKYVLQLITSHTNKNYMTPAKINRDIMAEHEALLSEYDAENLSLEEKLKEAEEKIASLTIQTQILTETNESLRKTIADFGSQGLIEKSDIPEFFDEEQHDAIIKALKIALKSMGTDTRLYEVTQSLLDCNKVKGYGTMIYADFKKMFSSGANLNKAEMAKLQDLGFDIISEKTHKKLIFKGNEKYCFPLASTGSDNKRGGLNFAGDVLHKLSIY